MRRGGGDGLHGVGDLPVHDVGERRRGAFVRHVPRAADAGHRVEEFGEKMRRRPGAGGRECVLRRIGLDHRDELFRIRRRERRINDQGERRRGDQAHRREILQRLVGRLLQVRHDRERSARGGEQRVAIGRALHHGVGADRAAGAGLVVDDERLAERVLQLLRDHARRDVGGLARRPGHDHFHRVVRIRLRKRGCRGERA